MINVGDKFIIEIDKIFEHDGEKLYRAKGFKSLVFGEYGLKMLKRFQDEDEEIKIGDVVKHKEGKTGVVISFTDSVIYGLTSKGCRFEWFRDRCTKTGKHIDIKSIMEQINDV